MNQHAKIDTKIDSTAAAKMSPEEWQARVDLAAVYRLCAKNGWDDIIYNHCSMRVPGEPSKFLMKQHELLWTEVTVTLFGLMPVVVPTTVTVTMQVAPTARLPPASEMALLPPAAVTVPPQVFVTPGVAATTTPAGSASVKERPVRTVVAFGFVIVKVTVDV